MALRRFVAGRRRRVSMTAVPGDSATAIVDVKPAAKTGGAAHVALGILVSRLFGIVRQALTATFLGATGPADAFQAAFKITNFLQNLFGEGALSASFIPVYSKLVKKDPEEAGRVAGAVGAILALAVSIIVLVGIIATPLLIPLIAQGFDGDRREMTIRLTRILFPGAGLFVISAWCLGILNTPRQVSAVVSRAGVLEHRDDRRAARCRSSTGRARSGDDARLGIGRRRRAAVSRAGSRDAALRPPSSILVGIRGLRTSAPWFETSDRRSSVAASCKSAATSTTGWRRFFRSAWSRRSATRRRSSSFRSACLGCPFRRRSCPRCRERTGTRTRSPRICGRASTRGLRQIAYFVIPSAAAFLAFGDVIAALLFQRGKFTAADSRYAWGILAGAAIGLLASTMGRLYSSTYYALHDTRTPLRFALVRVTLTTLLGYLFALWLPPHIGIDAHWGAAGLTASAGIAGWIFLMAPCASCISFSGGSPHAPDEKQRLTSTINAAARARHMTFEYTRTSLGLRGLYPLIKERLPGGASRLAALLLPHILPVCSVVAPCHPGAALRNPGPCSANTGHQVTVPGRWMVDGPDAARPYRTDGTAIQTPDRPCGPDHRAVAR